MLRTEVTETGVCARDAGEQSLAVTGTGWSAGGDGPEITRLTDATVNGRASELEMPSVYVRVERLDTDAVYELRDGVRTADLASGSYLVRIDGPVLAYIRFDGAARLDYVDGDGATLSFPERTRVTLGFRSQRRTPPGTVTVPQTVDGVARGLTALAAGTRTQFPDRSLPGMRGHPPLLEFGEELSVPDAVTSRRVDTDVTITLPADLRYLFPAAPLAYYLGASVTVEDGADPTVRTPRGRWTLEPLPEFQWGVATMLRRVFLLDCLVRNAGSNRTTMPESSHLRTLGLDADDLYGADVATRLDAYLDARFDRVSESLPEWHLSMYVEPEYEQVTTLPYLLSNLPFVFLAETKHLDAEERLSRSLDEFYRGACTQSVPEVDLVKPVLGPGSAHGWLADGVPIDVFKSVPDAYENRPSCPRSASETLSVVAVLNDAGMADEHTDVARIYRERAKDLDIDFELRKGLSTDELADLFETPHDLVHYIGHCEEAGLRCHDGHFSVTDIEESNVQTFFLNACGSFYQGIELLKRGSIAGAVTFDKVLDRHAARVGTAFVRLLIHGFSIERALELARRRIMMGKDYAVVGDGTHTLTHSSSYVPATVTVERLGDDRFRVTHEVQSPRVTGGWYQPPFDPDGSPRLLGSTEEATLSGAELDDLLGRVTLPVIYDGDLHWSDELRSFFG